MRRHYFCHLARERLCAYVLSVLSYVLRLSILLLKELFRAKIDPRAEVSMRVRAWPWYCDLNFHVNNAHFLTFLEYGRWAWLVRSGLMPRAIKERWLFLAGGISILYRRPLKWFRPLTIKTQIAMTSAKWIILEQEIYNHQGEPAARALIRVIMKQGRQHVPFQNIVGEVKAKSFSEVEIQSFEQLTKEHLRAFRDKISKDV